MNIVVNYEEWEYGCCRKPFKISDEVECEGNEPNLALNDYLSYLCFFK